MPTAFRTALNPSAGGLDSPPTSGYALWLDGRDTATLFTDAGITAITTNGQSVYQWNDKSGSSRNATQATSASRPIWVDSTSGRNGYGAVSFNGGQWLGSSASGVSNIGTGSFTFESWIRPTSYSGNKILFYTGSGGFLLYLNSTGRLIVSHYGVADYITSPSAISTTAWTHIAVSRSGSTMRLFINGSQTNSVTNSANYAGSGYQIGYDTATSTNPLYNGRMQNILVYNGQALYTSNFTPWMS